MVWVLPATVADAVRTVAAVAVWPAVGLLADGPPAAAAAVTPPAAARAARAIPAMMSLGCRMVSSLRVGQATVVPLSTTRTGQRAWRVQRHRRRRVRHASHRPARASRARHVPDQAHRRGVFRSLAGSHPFGCGLR